MKRNPALALIFAAIIVILLLIGYYSGGTSTNETQEWDFKGVVEQVTKSLTTTTITVNGKSYILETLKLKPGIDIQKGDTVIKKKGDLMLKMIKPGTRDTIYCSGQ